MTTTPCRRGHYGFNQHMNFFNTSKRLLYHRMNLNLVSLSPGISHINILMDYTLDPSDLGPHDRCSLFYMHPASPWTRTVHNFYFRGAAELLIPILTGFNGIVLLFIR